MIRIKRGSTVKTKHKNTLLFAKGYTDRASSSIRLAYQRIKKAMQYQYRDRRRKKLDFSKKWISQINNSSRQYGISYSNLMYLLKKQNIFIDKKIISLLSTYEPVTLESLFNVIQGNKF